jgi:NADH-quinone oxidoreductase subunit L
MNTWFVALPVVLPGMGFVLLFLLQQLSPKLISKWVLGLAMASLASAVGLLVMWILGDQQQIHIVEYHLYQDAHYQFTLAFLLDYISLSFVLAGHILALLIFRLSNLYLAGEKGYSRFFYTLFFFLTGYTLAVLSGNFETLLLGWEVLGLSSFMLVAFYRERYLPVKHAVRIFSVYRIGDVGLLLALWASHHYWHQNIAFETLSHTKMVHSQWARNPELASLITGFIFLAAMIKSAQFPFSSWLPRAMEGPTPSSAIFYGALSVHLGVFLLMRTFPFWEPMIGMRILLGVIGATTAWYGYSVSKSQYTIKAQIAYASLAQIGLMFITLALGQREMALVHMMGNAGLRTYQLLISPSVVSYTIRAQRFGYHLRPFKVATGWWQRLQVTLFVNGLFEWHLDAWMNRWVFGPWQQMGRQLVRLPDLVLWAVVVLLPVAAVLAASWNHDAAAWVCAMVALFSVVRAFGEKANPMKSWTTAFLGQVWLAIAIGLHQPSGSEHVMWYFSGLIPSFLLGLVCLFWLKKKEPNTFHLVQYQGLGASYPRLSGFFFLATLGASGFPITPMFIGEDLLLSHIELVHPGLALIFALVYFGNGIVLIRHYARLFLGPDAQQVPQQALMTS